MVVKCDKGCKKIFDILIQSEEHGEIIESFFRCPHCQKKYVISVTNKEIREMQKGIKQLTDSLKDLPKDSKEYAETYEKIVKSKELAIRKMKRLQKKFKKKKG
nr:hypothetical protein 23 [Bacillaceae bacterium]